MSSKRKNDRNVREAARNASDRRWRISITAFFTVLALGLVALFVATKPPTPGVGPEGTKKFSYAVRDHVTTPVEYKESPAVGGAHHPAWQACGFYREAIQPEFAVHSLEHGAVWVTYRPNLTSNELEDLRTLIGNDGHLLVSPQPGQQEPVVVSAWNHQLRVDKVDDGRIRYFVRAFIRGPQTPEPGASCGQVPNSTLNSIVESNPGNAVTPATPGEVAKPTASAKP